jgi:hypothetical protein
MNTKYSTYLHPESFMQMHVEIREDKYYLTITGHGQTFLETEIQEENILSLRNTFEMVLRDITRLKGIKSTQNN